MKYGNLVRVCLNVHRKTKFKSRWVNPNKKFHAIKDQYEYTSSIKCAKEESLKLLVEEYDILFGEVVQPIPNKVLKKKFNGNPLDLSIQPGQRHFMTWIFVKRCVEQGLSKDETLSLGKTWLDKNKAAYKSTYGYAVRELTTCVRENYI